MNNTTTAEPVDHGLADRGHHSRLARPHSDDEGAILAAEHTAGQLRSAGQPFGPRGKRFDRGSPFYLGVMLSAGVAVTYGAVRVLGSALRLALTLSGGVVRLLSETRISREGGNLVLEVPAVGLFGGDTVQRRLDALGRALGLAVTGRRVAPGRL